MAAFSIVCACCPSALAAVRYTVADSGTLGGSTSFAYGINSSGQVTGLASVEFDGGLRAFVYDGAMNDLGTLGGSHRFGSYGWDINDSEHITGWARTSNEAQHAFLYDGTMHDLGTLGGSYSIGQSINSSGMVTGWSETANGGQHAFLYDGAMHDLALLGGFEHTSSIGYGINDQGHVVGAFDPVGDGWYQHAFLYDGVFHDLRTLGGTSSEARAINAHGHIVGFANTAQNANTHAFLYDGTMHDLGIDGLNSAAYGINSNGHVVGQAGDANGRTYAFLYTNVTGMVDLNSLVDPSLGYELLNATDINDAGQIVGYGVLGGQYHAFLLTPVPEPHTMAPLVMGIAMVRLRFTRSSNRGTTNGWSVLGRQSATLAGSFWASLRRALDRLTSYCGRVIMADCSNELTARLERATTLNDLCKRHVISRTA
jgi:probable HAF family extracellular repeat protein